MTFILKHSIHIRIKRRKQIDSFYVMFGNKNLKFIKAKASTVLSSIMEGIAVKNVVRIN